MKPIHFAFAAIAIALAGSAGAAVMAPKTYTFVQPNQTVNSQGTGSGQGTAAFNAGYAGYNAANGTNYGDWRTFRTSDGSTVTVTAWGSTGALLHGGTTGYDRAIQSAFVSQFNNGANGSTTNNELAVTSRPDTNTSGANNNELLNCASGSTSCSANSNAPNYEHGMDNVGGYESLMFAFGSAVTLSDVTIGFPSGSTPDSDATVLVYLGTTPPDLTGTARTYADLVAPGGGWAVAGNLGDLATKSGALSSTYSSKYWMVGAYLGVGGNACSPSCNVGNDSIKLTSITVRAVPEPGSIALFGIAGAALFAGRRRKARKD